MTPYVWLIYPAIAALLAIGYVGFLLGCHRFPPSSPKFEVEPERVREALKALREMQQKQNQHQRERLLAAFGYPKDFA